MAKLGDIINEDARDTLRKLVEAKKNPADKSLKVAFTSIQRALDHLEHTRRALGKDAIKVPSLKEVEQHLKKASAVVVSKTFGEFEKMGI